MRIRCLAGLCLAATFSVAGLGATGPIDAPKDALLADAVQRGDRQAVLSLLKEQADVNAPQSDGATALHWAAYLEDAETTALLLCAGAQVNTPNNYGVTPLVLASGNGNAAVLEQLLKAGADPNTAVRSEETPLMLAARTGRVDGVKVLLEGGADVNAKEAWNGQTALMWAAAAGHGPVVKLLLDHGADIRARSNAGTTPFLFAVRKGDMSSVQTMLAAGADVNEKRPDLATPLLVAIINGHEDLVDLLLEKGADPNAEGGSTQLTVQGSRARPVKIQLETPPIRQQLLEVATEGGNRSNNSWGKPLQAAVHVANWHISDQFIAVNIDRLRVIKSLLAHGADVNGRNTDMEPRWSGARYRRRLVGATAFLFAAKVADVEVMRLLLDHGADPTINTGVNITPLMAAAGIAWASNQDRASEAEVLEAVKLLVEEVGADVNAVNDVGETAMHAAAYRGANSVVQYLYDKGAKLDVVALDGRTPLIIADGVEYGNSFAANPHTAELLRKLGAKEMECPGLCEAMIPEEALANIPGEALR
ncbi:MAG TPA: ankyrin repeat domain-containing protein [Vicinamibacterales bacterium]|nr:ankyrin repeat domain-containing protein [Vicinamibacterales bacterium]